MRSRIGQQLHLRRMAPVDRECEEKFSHATISRWKSGRTAPTRRRLEACGRTLNLSAGEVDGLMTPDTGRGERPQTLHVPLHPQPSSDGPERRPHPSRQVSRAPGHRRGHRPTAPENRQPRTPPASRKGRVLLLPHTRSASNHAPLQTPHLRLPGQGQSQPETPVKSSLQRPIRIPNPGITSPSRSASIPSTTLPINGNYAKGKSRNTPDE